MMKKIALVLLMLLYAATVWGMEKMEHDSGKHQMDDGQKMAHTFEHEATVDSLDAKFQVMSLESMNISSETGETHHIMVNLSPSGSDTPIKKAKGKIKVIAPDGKEQVSELKNYSGVLAANFNFTDPGKYGVICLVKNEAKKHVFKFWYEHGM